VPDGGRPGDAGLAADKSAELKRNIEYDRGMAKTGK
jgi:hypothetical protein